MESISFYYWIGFADGEAFVCILFYSRLTIEFHFQASYSFTDSKLNCNKSFYLRGPLALLFSHCRPKQSPFISNSFLILCMLHMLNRFGFIVGICFVYNHPLIVLMTPRSEHCLPKVICKPRLIDKLNDPKNQHGKSSM